MSAPSTSSPPRWSAIFDADQRLTFYNAAYSALWQLDSAFLDDKPTDNEILDRLRTLRRLPEQPDFQSPGS